MAKQPKGKNEIPTAVHSYLHLVRKNGIHPYIKRPLDLRSVICKFLWEQKFLLLVDGSVSGQCDRKFFG